MCSLSLLRPKYIHSWTVILARGLQTILPLMVFSDGNNWLSLPGIWICSLSFHNIHKVQVLLCSFLQNTTNFWWSYRGEAVVSSDQSWPGAFSLQVYAAHATSVRQVCTPGPCRRLQPWASYAHVLSKAQVKKTMLTGNHLKGIQPVTS